MSKDSPLLARAEALLEQRLLGEAIACFEQAEQQGTDADACAAGRWMAYALQGDLAAAWNESDAIRYRGMYDPNRFWQGGDVRGKRVMLRCLHGFGDSVQFLRYAPRLRNLASHLTVECAPEAVDLIDCLPGIDQIITWNDVEPEWQIQLEVTELPYFFRSTIAELPIDIGYLRLLPEELRSAARLLGVGSSPRIGIAWSSGEWNPSRSIPLDMLVPVLSRKDCQYWNIQGGPVRAEWQRLPVGPHLRDTSALADAGLLPLAAVIANLDLVITVDTLAAHLAGALNVPCFLLLQYAADWRWMVKRDDSPWYPSLRLFRQAAPGDWAGVVRDLERALDYWVRSDTNWRAVA